MSKAERSMRSALGRVRQGSREWPLARILFVGGKASAVVALSVDAITALAEQAPLPYSLATRRAEVSPVSLGASPPTNSPTICSERPLTPGAAFSAPACL